MRSIVPGFRLTLGYTLLYLSLIVLLPMAALLWYSSRVGVSGFAETLGNGRVRAAIGVSLWTSFAAAVITTIFGTIVAWSLVRYRFPGRKLIDTIIDLPFALPTAVAGIALTALYAPNGWIGSWLAEAGIRVAFTPSGIVLALAFVGLPFVVRTIQPVLAELDPSLEESAQSMGASGFGTFRHVIFPQMLPALLTGSALALARGIGEYGSVIFIAGNMPFRSEIAPLLIVTRLEEFDYAGATAIAVVMLTISLLMMLAINLLQRWARDRTS
jgi:sulfate/thiosulfate transport system permease protein